MPGEDINGSTAGNHSIPGRYQAPEFHSTVGPGAGNPGIPDSNSIQDGRPFGPELGCSGTDPGSALRVQYAPGPFCLGRESPGVYPQNPHRAARAVGYDSP